MLTRVEVRTNQGNLLNLSLENGNNGYQIDEIEGLDPVKANLVSSSFANQDGEQFQSSRREKRQLKFKLIYEPDFVNNTVRDLRHNLYNFFMPQSDVSLRFHDSLGSYVDIWGTVEEFDSPLFTDDPAADITLLCFNPDFIDPNPGTASGVSTADVTAFDTVNYFGTVDAGILFTLNLDRDISSFSIVHTAPDGKINQLDFQYALLAGDKLIISSLPGAKGATLVRGSTETSVLYSVSPQSAWIRLKKGANKIRVAIAGTGIPYEIRYITRYGGL